MTITTQEWWEVFQAEPIEYMHVAHSVFLIYDRSLSLERGWKVVLGVESTLALTSRLDNGDFGGSVSLRDPDLAERLGLPLLDMGDDFDDVSPEMYKAYMLGVMRQPEAKGWFVPSLELLDLAYTGARGTYSGRPLGADSPAGGDKRPF